MGHCETLGPGYAPPQHAAAGGIRHVLVNGTFVVRDGSVVADARPGRPVRGEPGWPPDTLRAAPFEQNWFRAQTPSD
jgi:hypothetical protein